MPGHPLPAPSVTVSVASHGQRNLVAALLEQLATLRDPSLARVVIVHNLPDADLPKPPDATFDLVQLHNPEPLGFSANHNRAFAHCVTPWFAVLNPDLEFRFGNPFPALLEAAAANSRLGAVAPTLLQPGTLHVEPPRDMVTPIELIRRRLPGFRPPSEPAWLVGAFIMFRTDSFAEIGGFDKRFRLYCEDVDIGMRLLASGWRIHRSTNVHVVHLTARHSHQRINYMLMHLHSLLLLWAKMARIIDPAP